MAVRFIEPAEIERFRQAINDDPEFKLSARLMTKDILLGVGESQCLIRIKDGVIIEMLLNPPLAQPPSFSIIGPTEFWEKFLQPVPPPLFNDIFVAISRRTAVIRGDIEAAFAHFLALVRMLNIMRDLQNQP